MRKGTFLPFCTGCHKPRLTQDAFGGGIRRKTSSSGPAGTVSYKTKCKDCCQKYSIKRYWDGGGKQKEQLWYRRNTNRKKAQAMNHYRNTTQRTLMRGHKENYGQEIIQRSEAKD